MPRKLLQRFLPHPKLIKENKYLRFLGGHLHAERLWQIHRRSIAKAVAIGFFVMFMPMPMQMLLAAILAIIFSANILLSAATVWISNPITMGPMLFFAYKIGTWVLPGQHHFDKTISLLQNLSKVWAPLLLGCFICGAACAVIGYIGTSGIWRISVNYRWRNRSKRSRKRGA